MTLVQITQRRGVVKRVPRDASPCVELNLEPNQRVVKFDISPSTQWPPSYSNAADDRKTLDWHWVAWVETRL